MHSISVHVERPTPRNRYAIRQVLDHLLGWQVEWVDDPVRFAGLHGPRLVYGTAPVAGALHIVPAGLLETSTKEGLDPVVVEREGMPVLFPVDGGDLPFDPFAGAFFLLSRYQEVVGMTSDAIGRPIAAALHQTRHGYLDRPIVDEWALALATAWRHKDPALPDPVRRYRQVVTMDLDNGFMYRGREIWRSMGSAMRDLFKSGPGRVWERLRVLSGARPDPYDVYDRLQAWLSELADRSLFFVLAADRGTHDHAVPLTYGPYTERIKQLSAWAEVGVHPSFDSSLHETLIGEERARVERAIGATVTLGRQHFLRMRLPATYRALVHAGITEEHTMGLHDAVGFRAGTCTPYMWYDLEEERETALRVHPFAVMDNALRDPRNGRPDPNALERVHGIIERVRAVRGTFTGVWHEAYWSDHGAHQGWRDVILRILENARP